MTRRTIEEGVTTGVSRCADSKRYLVSPYWLVELGLGQRGDMPIIVD